MKKNSPIDVIPALALALSITAVIVAILAYHIARGGEQISREKLLKTEIIGGIDVNEPEKCIQKRISCGFKKPSKIFEKISKI